jgi:hypothetical protein
MKLHSAEVVFLSFCVLALVIATLGFFFAPVTIPIWYSLPVPDQQLDSRAWLFLFPIAMMVIALLHRFFIKLTRPIDPRLSELIVWATCIPMSILLIALIHILVITI